MMHDDTLYLIAFGILLLITSAIAFHYERREGFDHTVSTLLFGIGAGIIIFTIPATITQNGNQQ